MKRFFFFLAFSGLIAVDSYAQAKRQPVRSIRSAAPARTAPVRPAPAAKPADTPRVMQLAPLMIQGTFVAANVQNQSGSRELKTLGSNFRTGDNSTSKNISTKTSGNQMCASQQINTELNTLNFKDFTIYGPPDWLKPGILMEAKSFVQGTERIEEKYDRSPITISTTAPKAAKRVTTVQNPKNKSAITDAIGDLLSQDNSQTGALITFSYHRIFTSEDLNYKINGKFSTNFSDIAAKFGVSGSKKNSHNYFLVEFTQTLFSLEVDGLDKEKVFLNYPNAPLDEYVYISKVNYGRRGYIMFTSQKSLEEFNISAEAGGSYAGMSAQIKSNLGTIASSEDTRVEAFYYGGDVKGAVDDILAGWDKEGRVPLEDYIKAYRFSPAEAYPVSYELKNLDNEKIGMTSKSTQTVETCVPLPKKLKLKVSLAGIDCETTEDRDKYADYELKQHVFYKVGGKIKTPIQKKYNKFGSSCTPNGLANSNGYVPLICGSDKQQIHVAEQKYKSVPREKRGDNVSNFVVYEIDSEEASANNAEFIIRTYLKEKSDDWRGNPADIMMNNDNPNVEVAIKDVLATLTKARTLSNDGKYRGDGAMDQNLTFDYFGGGNRLQLTQVTMGNDGRIILEGAIRARNSGKDVREKAFLWVRFELID